MIVAYSDFRSVEEVVVHFKRAKEEAFDYRYFLDPDLLPLVISDDYIQSIKSTMPLMLEQREALYREQQDVEYLLLNLDVVNYYDQIAKTVL